MSVRKFKIKVKDPAQLGRPEEEDEKKEPQPSSMLIDNSNLDNSSVDLSDSEYLKSLMEEIRPAEEQRAATQDAGVDPPPISLIPTLAKGIGFVLMLWGFSK